jgi:inorganic pyrophosphatase
MRKNSALPKTRLEPSNPRWIAPAIAAGSAATVEDFWQFLDELLRRGNVVIDRPRGSVHPRYPDSTYPLDYGFLHGSNSSDGAALDVWLGAAPSTGVQAILCTVDLGKSDAEIKLIAGCSLPEIQAAVDFCNRGSMRSLLIQRQPGPDVMPKD